MKRPIPFLLASGVFAFFILFLAISPVAAQGLIGGDTIPAGTVLEQDVILTGQNVRIDGDVIGNVFILGNQVIINGDIDGSLILIGENARIGGKVSGGVYAAAVTLDLTANAQLLRDLYIASISLTSEKNAAIGRDLYAVGLDSGLNGQIARDLHTAIGPIQLYNGLMTLLGFSDLTIKLNLLSPQNSGGNTHFIAPAGYLARIRTEAAASSIDWNTWEISLLRNGGTLLVICLLMYFMGKQFLQQSALRLLERPWRTLGTGFLVIVFSFLMLGVVLLISALVFEIGLGLNYLGLWQISLAFWLVVYAGLAIFVVGLWIFLTFISKIIIIYILSDWVLSHLFPSRKTWPVIGGLVVMTILYTMLRSVPYAGLAIGVLVTAAGAGTGWEYFRVDFRKNKASLKEVKPKLGDSLTSKKSRKKG